MASPHGTRARYIGGCHCEECQQAQAIYQKNYRERAINNETAPYQRPAVDAADRAVELAVMAEVEGLAQAESRPGLVQAALSLARILDNPRAPGPQPAAAKQLADLLDRLRKGADQRRSRLASVKQMTDAG